MSSAQRVLLTSVCRPFGTTGEGDSVGAELFHAQVTRAQGPFSLRQVIRVWALDYLAENICAPTVTLHYPSERELVRELKSHHYTHVGINFVLATFHKVRRMVPIIRRHAPHAKIILGGYGTVLPNEVLGSWADAICREEGVGYLRRLLGEDLAAPVRPPHAPIPSVQVLGHQQDSVVGHVTAGLGCPNGCDFCCTSHFFGRRYVPYLRTGREIYEALLSTRTRAEHDGMQMKSFILIDEDFFLQHRRARELLDCMREGGESLSLMGFGSVRGLSQFSAREIAELGFDVVWNAFEGKNSGYSKQKGKPLSELYTSLKSVGCAQLTSMIIGFPYQDEAIIRDELEELLRLEPALTQCLIYFAFPGTPLHARMVAEGRYLPQQRNAPDLRRYDGFAMHFKHPHFQHPEQLEQLQSAIYRQDYERLGPSPLRLGRVWLTGYLNLRNDPSPLLRARAERLRGDARSLLPVARATARWGPNQLVRERSESLYRDIVDHTGSPSAKEYIAESLAPWAFLGSLAARHAGLLQQPGLLRTEHRTKSTSMSLHTRQVLRLQGAPRSGLLRSLAEDLATRLSSLRSEAPSAWPGMGSLNQRSHPMGSSLPQPAVPSSS